jgi:hypothetical protein
VSVCDEEDTEYRTWKSLPYCLPPQAIVAGQERFRVSPNPFGPSTTIAFQMEQDGPVSARIYSVGGRLLRTLVQADLGPGRHERVWQGETDDGTFVGAGIYYLVLETPGRKDHRKLVMF